MNTAIKTGTVFAVQEDPKKNLLPAEKFGKVCVLAPFGQVNYDTGTLIDAMAEKLENFDLTKDHLLLVGDPVMIAIAASLVSHLTNGYYSVLKWDRQEKQYHSVTIDLGEEE